VAEHTFLFADLAGSTELALTLDAEHLRAFLADVYNELSQAAAAFGEHDGQSGRPLPAKLQGRFLPQPLQTAAGSR